MVGRVSRGERGGSVWGSERPVAKDMAATGKAKLYPSFYVSCWPASANRLLNLGLDIGGLDSNPDDNIAG